MFVHDKGAYGTKGEDSALDRPRYDYTFQPAELPNDRTKKQGKQQRDKRKKKEKKKQFKLHARKKIINFSEFVGKFLEEPF